MIKIEINFTDGEKFEQLIRYIEGIDFVRAEAEVGELSDKVIESMKETINSSRKRPDKGTHKLENSLDWTEVLNDPGRQLIIGIGEVAKLMAEAPYFEVLDVGGYIPNNGNFVPLGAFAPGEPRPNAGNFREGNWEVGGKFTFKPKKAIEGIGYINKAIQNLDNDLRALVEKLGGMWLDGMSGGMGV